MEDFNNENFNNIGTDEAEATNSASDSSSESVQDASKNTSAQPSDSSDHNPDISTEQNNSQNDPYNKYNFYRGAGSGVQQTETSDSSFTQSVYSAQAPQYSGAYQQSGFQNYGYQGMNQQPGSYQGQTQPGAGYPGQEPQGTSYQNQNYQNQGYQGQSYQNTVYQAQESQNQGYQGQGISGQGYQNPGTQNQGYQNMGYQGSQYQSNPYPTGRISYVSNIDSIYPEAPRNKEKTKKEKSGVAKFFTGLAMSAAFGLVAAGVFCLIMYFYREQNPELFSSGSKEVQVTTTQSKNDSRLNLDPAEGTQVPSTNIIDGATFTGTDVTDVVSKNMPAIVAINCTVPTYNYWYGTTYNASSAGSGIIVAKNSKELMIATNYHVVEKAKDIKVNFIDGTTAPATIKGKDEVADLAVLSISLNDISEDTLNAIAIATLGDSDELKVGEMAIAIGNALGYGQSVTVGYISGKDREIKIEGQTFTGLLQTDAAINPGNSGGALLNIKGEVIGINNAKISGSDVEGMGYAIPISRAQDILAEFMARETLSEEEQGYLGVVITTVTSELAAAYKWPIGAYITEISEGSAAEKAGLMVGDIITKVDAVDITSNKTLVEKIQSMRHGSEATITIQRRVDGEFKEMEIPLILGQRPLEEDKDSSNKDTEQPSTDKQDQGKKIPEGDSLPNDNVSNGQLPDGQLPNGQTPDGSRPDGQNPGFNIPGLDDSDSFFPDFLFPDEDGSFPGIGDQGTQIPGNGNQGTQLPNNGDAGQIPGSEEQGTLTPDYSEQELNY